MEGEEGTTPKGTEADGTDDPSACNETPAGTSDETELLTPAPDEGLTDPLGTRGNEGLPEAASTFRGGGLE